MAKDLAERIVPSVAQVTSILLMDCWHPITPGSFRVEQLDNGDYFFACEATYGKGELLFGPFSSIKGFAAPLGTSATLE